MRGVTSRPQHSPVFSSTHLCSPALTCVLQHSPVFSSTHLCSPALTCVLQRSPVFSSAHLCSPALTCVLQHSPVFSSTHLCSPALHCPLSIVLILHVFSSFEYFHNCRNSSPSSLLDIQKWSQSGELVCCLGFDK